MSPISVICVHTPQQTDALQAATGLLLTISRHGAKLVRPADYKGLLDGYDQTDRESWLSTPGAFAGEMA